MKIIGLMSGTSLDGIDLILCDIDEIDNKFIFKIIKTQTIKYSDDWKHKLKTAHNLNALDFIFLHKQYGKYLGNNINDFIQHTQKPELIASHGHTIFHDPEKALTFQLGNGAFIAAQTGISCVSDFRTLDTALGGQGAPLVPVGDELLFSEYKYCLNLGGFSNISYENNDKKRIAFDISPVNFALNHFAELLNQDFDKDGELGRSGIIDNNLLNELNNIEYYSKNSPKSLSREFFEKIFLPIVQKYKIGTNDILRTIYEHITIQIKNIIDNNYKEKLLITGGGAKNTFLIELLKSKVNNEIIIPSEEIIDYKEALIFALLAYLRINIKKNTLRSVTGSKFDNYGGVVNLI